MTTFFIFTGASFAQQKPGKSDFLSLCREFLIQEPKKQSSCTLINNLFFAKKPPAEIAPFRPEQIKVKAEAIDKKIQFVAFNDPNYLPSVAYCYFVYRHWLDPKKFSPDELALNASGFSILNEDIDGYQKWLIETSEGKGCKKGIEKESMVPVADLKESLKGYIAFIGINPVASVRLNQGNYENVIRDLSTTVAHERIHAYQVLCPDFGKWSLAQWERLPAADKQEFAQKYPAYHWQDKLVAGREYVAFTYEKTPEKIVNFLGSCQIK